MRKKRILFLIGSIVFLVLGTGGFFGFMNYRMSQVPNMSFDEMLTYTTNNNKKAVITVGIIQQGEASYTVYGENGIVLPKKDHIYEIGSLTKTFTTTLLFQAIFYGKVSLDDQIDSYLELPAKDYYPTIRSLITHTSGYNSYYFETEMISNFFHNRNDYFGISTAQLVSKVGKINLKDQDYEFKYSNFGMAVIGAVLSTLYGEGYTDLLNAYIHRELNLWSSKISDGYGDLGNYWDWEKGDAYIPAGGMTSTITDMLQYTQLQLKGTPEYIFDTQQALERVDTYSDRQRKMNIHVNAVGAGWMIDKVNHIIWHNGGTGNYNCYVGFDPDKQIAVVILSNQSPNYRIPATIMGIKLLTELQAGG